MNMTPRSVLNNHGMGNGGNPSSGSSETLEFHNFYRTQQDDEYTPLGGAITSGNHPHHSHSHHNDNRMDAMNHNGYNSNNLSNSGGNTSNFQGFPYSQDVHHHPHHLNLSQQHFHSQLLQQQQNGNESRLISGGAGGGSGGGNSGVSGMFPFAPFTGGSQPQQMKIVKTLNLSLGKDMYKVLLQSPSHIDTTSSSPWIISFDKEPTGTPRFVTSITSQLVQEVYGNTTISDFSSLVFDALMKASKDQHFDYRFCTQNIPDIQRSRLFSTQEKIDYDSGCTMLVLQLAVGNSGGDGKVIHLPAMLQVPPSRSSINAYSNHNHSSNALLDSRGDNRSRSGSSASLNVIGSSMFGMMGNVENISRPGSSFDPLDISSLGGLGGRDSGTMSSGRTYGVFGTPFGNGGGSGSSTPRSQNLLDPIELSKRVRVLEMQVNQIMMENKRMMGHIHQLQQQQQQQQQPGQPQVSPSQQQQQQQQQKQTSQQQQKQKQNIPPTAAAAAAAAVVQENALAGQWGQKGILNKSAAEHVSSEVANMASQKTVAATATVNPSASNTAKKQHKQSHENSPRDRSSSSSSSVGSVSYTAAAQIAKKVVAPVKVVQAHHQSQPQQQQQRPLVVVAQPPSALSDHHTPSSTTRGSPQDITLLVIPIDRKKPWELIVPKKVGVSRERVFDFLTKQNIFTSYASEPVSDIELYWKSPMLPEPIIKSNDQQKGLVIYRAAKGKNPFTKVNALFEEYRTDNREDLRIMYGPVVLARQTRSGEVRSFHLRDYDEVVADKKKQVLRG